MKIFFVRRLHGWGRHQGVVRAETPEEAAKLLGFRFLREEVMVEELPEGKGVLWEEEDSPDSPRERD